MCVVSTCTIESNTDSQNVFRTSSSQAAAIHGACTDWTTQGTKGKTHFSAGEHHGDTGISTFILPIFTYSLMQLSAQKKSGTTPCPRLQTIVASRSKFPCASLFAFRLMTTLTNTRLKFVSSSCFLLSEIRSNANAAFSIGAVSRDSLHQNSACSLGPFMQTPTQQQRPWNPTPTTTSRGGSCNMMRVL